MSSKRNALRIVSLARAVALGAVLVALACSLLFAASCVLQPKNNQKEFGMLHPEANGILGERAHSIDAVFVGDSEAFSTFSPMQMWGEQGFTSYVCATSAQSLPYGNTLLRRALREQRPRVVVFETNSIYAPFSFSDAAWRLAQDAFPVLEYHNRWKSLRPDDFAHAARSTWTDDFKGFLVSGKVDAADASGHMAPAGKAKPVPLLNRMYLQAMVDCCRAHGATPLLMSVPSTVNWNTERHNGISKLAREMGVGYLDLNVEPYRAQLGIDWSADTRDRGDHLNQSGACKVSRLVGSYLKKEYALPDKRGNASYASWAEAYVRYERKVAAVAAA